jgi:crooked neck
MLSCSGLRLTRGAQAAVQIPKRVKKKRHAVGPDGADLGMEEYLDYVFPDEDQAAPLAKLLAAAKRWQQEGGS